MRPERPFWLFHAPASVVAYVACSRIHITTTSGFSQDAHDYVDTVETRIVLIDGPQLAQYMIDTGIGVTEARTYRTHRIDTDTFSDDGSAVAT